MKIPIEQCNFVAEEIREEKTTVLVHCQLKRNHDGEHKPPIPASGKLTAIGVWAEIKD